MIPTDQALAPVIRAHVDAVLERLRAHPYLEHNVFEGLVPQVDGETRNDYVSVFWNSGRRSGERLDGLDINLTMTFTFHWVSINPATAGDLAQAGLGQLIGWTPTIAGRKCWRLGNHTSLPIDAEKSITPWLWFGVDTLDLKSTPAN